MSCFVRRIEGPDRIEADVGLAWRMAQERCGVSTLILPGDAAWTATDRTWSGSVPAIPAPEMPPAAEIDRAIAAIRSGHRCTVVLGGRALRADCLAVAGRLTGAGVRLMSEPSNGRIERLPGQAPLMRMPYGLDDAVAALAAEEIVITIGARKPSAFFAYPGKPTLLCRPGTLVIGLCPAEGDCLGTLAALAEAAGRDPVVPAAPRAVEIPQGSLTEEAVARIVAADLPENAIVCDESITSCVSFFYWAEGRVPHDYLQLTGGAIGIGIPLATGAAIACPDRPVISLQADGSAMYTVQGLWTQARENLDTITVLLSNRAYAVLQGEMRRVGVKSFGQNARRMLDLTEPGLDWVGLAQSMGVPATRAETTDAFRRALQRAIAEGGPHLIEAVI